MANGRRHTDALFLLAMVAFWGGAIPHMTLAGSPIGAFQGISNQETSSQTNTSKEGGWSHSQGLVSLDFGTSVEAANINRVRYANVFGGSDAGARIAAAIADLPDTGGIVDARGIEGLQVISSPLTVSKNNVTLLLGAATYASSANIVIADGVRNFHIRGIGNGLPGGTTISHSAPNCWISVEPTAAPQGIWIEDLSVMTTATSPSSGGICVGSPLEPYDSAKYRNDWRIRNVTINGPGPSKPGVVGVNLSQLGRLVLDGVHIIGYETDLVMCATTEATVSGVTLDAFLFGLKHLPNPRYPSGAGTQDRFLSLTAHGPDIGTTGNAIYEGLSGSQFFGAYLETGVSTINAAAMLA